MADPEFGSPCPGCTYEKITAQIARFPEAYPACLACRDSGALFHARHKNTWEHNRRASGIANGESHG
jgi:hypothetical protein